MIKNKNKIALLNVASTVILQGLAFISGPIFSGVLGTNNYGVAAVYLTWVQIASTVFSLQAGGTVALARVNYPLNDQPKFQSSVLSLATLSYMLFSILTIIVSLLASVWFKMNILMILLGLCHGWGMYIITFMNSKFTYEFKADKNFLLSITVSVLTIGLSILLIYLFPKSTNYWGRIIGQTVVYFSVGLIMYIYILKQGKLLFNKTYWRWTLPIAIPTIFHLLANIVLNQSDKVMLQGIVNNSAAGIYSLSCTFSIVLNTIWSALNNSWVPFYYEYTRQNQIEKMKKHAKNYTELFTIVAMGFILLAREVFHLYAKQSFWKGTDLIPLFSIGYYFIFLYSFPVNYEFYNKKTKSIAIVTTSAAICNIILNYLFIKLWGIQGAVIATAVSHGLQFGFHFICAKRINPGEFPFRLKQFVPGFLAVCGTCILYWFTREMWMIRWGLGAVLGCYLLVKIIKRREIF
ncbi:MAG: oligosaccharide flippase family protein [Ruminococcus sp.]|nr:oligosaccharide flippase family protein [Ruminococcus sp.]